MAQIFSLRCCVRYTKIYSIYLFQGTRVLLTEDNALKAEILIIAMTANAFSEDRNRALSVGMNDHVAKPIDMNVLTEVLPQYIVPTA